MFEPLSSAGKAPGSARSHCATRRFRQRRQRAKEAEQLVTDAPHIQNVLVPALWILSEIQQHSGATEPQAQAWKERALLGAFGEPIPPYRPRVLISASAKLIPCSGEGIIGASEDNAAVA